MSSFAVYHILRGYIIYSLTIQLLLPNPNRSSQSFLERLQGCYWKWIMASCFTCSSLQMLLVPRFMKHLVYWKRTRTLLLLVQNRNLLLCKLKIHMNYLLRGYVRFISLSPPPFSPPKPMSMSSKLEKNETSYFFPTTHFLLHCDHM